MNPFLEDLLRPSLGSVTRGARRRRQRRFLLVMVLAFLLLLGISRRLWPEQGSNPIMERTAPVAGLLTLSPPRIDRLEEVANGELPGVAGPMAIPAHVSGTIQSGQSLFAALVAHGIPETSIH
ncbi:MAG: hypothetical protein KGO50_10385, partial [Myxococcales bacterium]|nr:hypothetical protein [Myxococcales bacterium]